MIIRLLGITVLLAAIVAGWLWSDYRDFVHTPLALPEEGLVLEVPPGTNLKVLAARLQAQGVLRSADYLYWHARWKQLAHRIRAGEYRVEHGITPVQLLEQLVEGKVLLHTLTLVEGWSFQQMMAAIAASDVLRQDLQGLSAGQVMERIGQPGIHPEGRFFPDTYAFPRGTSDTDFLRRAFRRMQQELAEAWEQRAKEDAVVQTPEQALILASIIEKETGVPEERPEIAGVFSRRLRMGMKLQTDPTVIYGMGERYQGNIRRKDLREDTPYNTYVHKGLPPTPICMPGRAAIDAALNPEDGKTLYFVSRGDGSHVFSATLEQHNAAVRKYQLKK
jgi:UPF0755 protein